MPNIGAAASKRISLVVDPTLGARAFELAEKGPVWLATSPANRRTAEQLWRQGDAAPGWVTVFDPDGGDDQEVVSNILAAIDEHHPGGCQLYVLGAAPTDMLAAQLIRLGAGKAEATADGFVWTRD
jgi:hypothetical protein